MPTILLVDDHAGNLELLSAFLDGVAARILKARDGARALELVDSEQPDLVLLDVMMPGLDGFEVCRRLKGRDRLLPVVLVTGLSATRDRVAGLEAGADDFLTRPVERTELVARVRSLLRLKAFYDRLDEFERVVTSLALAVEAKDPFTDLHTDRVARTARLLGRLAGLEEAALDDLYLGAVAHDIGKIGIPDAVLLKAGPLAPEEWELMRGHVVIGESIVAPLRSAPALTPTVRHHHEHFDGGGYPDGLAGEAIPLEARIVAVCDAWDAMTNERPYRRALSAEQAEDVLRDGAGSQWDPSLVELFLGSVRGRPEAELDAEPRPA